MNGNLVRTYTPKHESGMYVADKVYRDFFSESKSYSFKYLRALCKPGAAPAGKFSELSNLHMINVIEDPLADPEWKTLMAPILTKSAQAVETAEAARPNAHDIKAKAAMVEVQAALQREAKAAQAQAECTRTREEAMRELYGCLLGALKAFAQAKTYPVNWAAWLKAKTGC